MGFNPLTLDTRAAADAGVWLTLKDPSENEVWDEGKPVQFRLIGRDGAVAKEAMSELDGKAGEALEGAAIDVLETCLKGWSDNITGDDGKPLAFTKENVRMLLEVPHIREWMMKALVDRSNFTKQPRKK